MNGENGEFKEFGDLAARLGRADFSGESRVRDTLRGSLLEKAERPARRRVFVWLLPAAAALAVALFMVNVRNRPLPAAAMASAAAAYGLPSDGYGDCGRQGLPDYAEEGRF
jgi:hypothetical protein